MTQKFSNFFCPDGTPWLPEKQAIYGDHLIELLEKLENGWSSFKDFEFIVYFHPVYSKFPEFKKNGKNTILIFLSDEEGLIPVELSDKFFAILKSYWSRETRLGNLISFPIGYSNSAKFTRFIPFEERKYSVSYAGNFFPNRWDFYRQLGGLKYFPPWPIQSLLLRKIFWHLYRKLGFFKPGDRAWIPDSRIYFSGGFAKGVSREEYGEIISQTKIALCPRGFISTECFRLFETMRLGCVIVADELPPTVWYKDSPIIVETDWLNIRAKIEKLLADPQFLMEKHRQTLEWWEKVCSEKPSAKYLAEQLSDLPIKG